MEKSQHEQWYCWTVEREKQPFNNSSFEVDPTPYWLSVTLILHMEQRFKTDQCQLRSFLSEKWNELDRANQTTVNTLANTCLVDDQERRGRRDIIPLSKGTHPNNTLSPICVIRTSNGSIFVLMTSKGCELNPCVIGTAIWWSFPVS